MLGLHSSTIAYGQITLGLFLLYLHLSFSFVKRDNNTCHWIVKKAQGDRLFVKNWEHSWSSKIELLCNSEITVNFFFSLSSLYNCISFKPVASVTYKIPWNLVFQHNRFFKRKLPTYCKSVWSALLHTMRRGSDGNLLPIVKCWNTELSLSACWVLSLSSPTHIQNDHHSGQRIDLSATGEMWKAHFLLRCLFPWVRSRT